MEIKILEFPKNISPKLLQPVVFVSMNPKIGSILNLKMVDLILPIHYKV